MFSIIVPTFNRASLLPAALKSLVTQDTAFPFEVIVVDNNSTDGTRACIQVLAAQAPDRVRYVFERAQGVSAARNAGIAAARGDVVAFIDDDAVAHSGWLAALADAYRTHPDAWCVGGKIVLQFAETLPPWFSRRSQTLTALLSGLDLGDAMVERRYPSEVWGCNFSLRRDVVDRVGPFDTALGHAGSGRIGGEEVDLCWRIQRAGGCVYYCGRAVVNHVVPVARMTKRFFRRNAYGKGRMRRLLDWKDLSVVDPARLSRGTLAVVKARIKAALWPGKDDQWQIFERELHLWASAGFWHEAMLRSVSRLWQNHYPSGL